MKFLLSALCDISDRCDVAAACINQTTYPSYGYMVQNGSTTLWELWQYDPFGTSHNHAMYAAVDEFLYGSVGGMRLAPDAIGSNHFLFEPQMTTANYASVTYDSVRGLFAFSWSVRSDGSLLLNMTVPVNARADLILPHAYSTLSYMSTNPIMSSLSTTSRVLPFATFACHSTVSHSSRTRKSVCNIGSGDHHLVAALSD